MKNFINLIVTSNKNKKRVDNVLNESFNELSRNKIKNLILSGALKINGKKEYDPSKKVKIGQNLYLKIPEEKENKLLPYDYKLKIVYEDNDILILDKEAGISIHPGAGNYKNTIVNALIHYNKNNLSDIGDKFRPGIVHRIDKDTSGLVVVAKNNLAHLNLSSQFKDHSITRLYLALVWGKLRPQSGRIENFITRSSKNRQMMEVNLTKGKKAITNYKTIEVFENKNTPTFSLVKCKLETGRTHQIRVHLSHKGNNILGDKHYKKKFKDIKRTDDLIKYKLLNLNRQFLHATILGFKHPQKDRYIEFESKLPNELYEIINILRNI